MSLWSSNNVIEQLHRPNLKSRPFYYWLKPSITINQQQADIELRQLAHRLQISLDDKRLLAVRDLSRQRFSPTLSYGRHFGAPMPTAKAAAVMVLLERDDFNSWTIPLTERPAHLPDHPGQISLPGGRIEIGEAALDAAVREFEEELGVTKFSGQVVGQLQPIYVYNSDYYVTPFVAVAPTCPAFEPCVHEVARVIRLPVTVLLDHMQHQVELFQRGLAEWESLVIRHDGVTIWGATAIMLAELAAVLEDVLSDSNSSM